MTPVERFAISAIGPLGEQGGGISAPIMLALNNDPTTWDLTNALAYGVDDEGRPMRRDPVEVLADATEILRGNVAVIPTTPRPLAHYGAGARAPVIGVGESYRAPLYGFLAYSPQPGVDEDLDNALVRGFIMWAWLLSRYLPRGHKVFWRQRPQILEEQTKHGDYCRFLKWQLAMQS